MQVREEPYLLDEIKEHYRDQSKLLGFEIKIPELALVKEGDKLEMMDRPDDALQIFWRCISFIRVDLWDMIDLEASIVKKAILYRQLNIIKAFWKDNQGIHGFYPFWRS